MNLIEKLQQEIKRVNEIIKIYDEIPAGNLAAAMMKHDVTKAEKAISQMETIEMIKSIKTLEEYEL